MLLSVHEYIKEHVELSAVSLRDVERFKSLYLWFIEYLIQTADVRLKSFKIDRSDKEKSERATALAIMFCYCLRFANDG